MSYCVIQRDQANYQLVRVRSKHRTKRAAQKKAAGRRHDLRVVKCGADVKRGSTMPAGRQMKRKRK